MGTRPRTLGWGPLTAPVVGPLCGPPAGFNRLYVLPRSRSRSPRRRAHSPERRREERSVPTAYRVSNSPGVSRKRTRSR